VGKSVRDHGVRIPRVLVAALIASLVFQLLAIPPRPAAANQLGFFQVIRGVQVAQAGYGGMRGLGTGSIAISGVTGGVAAAYLYWHGPTNSTDPNVNATVTLGGSSITGQNIGFANDNSWSFQNSQAYRADVTAIVKGTTFSGGAATFALANFRKTVGTTITADINGASLLVFYNDATKTPHDYLLWNGNDSNVASTFDPAGWDMTFTGISYTSGAASLILHVADGQDFADGPVALNGTTFLAAGNNFQGDSTPFATRVNGSSDGSLWDIHTYDIASFLSPSTTSLQVTSSGGSDALSLIVALLELPAGKITLAPSLAAGLQGSPLSFTATPVDGSSATKTVTFSVSGANTVAPTAVQTDTSGHAAFTYTPASAGTDTVTATFTDVNGVLRSATATANLTPTTVSGVAQCSRQTGESLTTVVLNSAAGGLVEVLSGGAVVVSQSVTTTDGSYSFSGFAPNAKFTVRYSGVVSGVHWTCDQNVTTNAFGGSLVAAPGAIVDRGNHRFANAYAFPAGGGTVTDYAYLPHQSDYYKVQAGQGQAISIHASNFSRNLEVLLYKDPFAILASMHSGSLADIQSSTMGGAAPDELGFGAPDEFGFGAPDEFGFGAPDEFGFGAPDEFGWGAPDELGFGAPDELGFGAPDEFGFGAPDPTDYSTAIRRALVAVSRTPGTGDESFTKQTWNDAGWYYIRIVGATAADYDASTPFSLSVNVVDSACVGVTLTQFQPSTILQAAPTNSLVVTNTARLLHADGTALTAIDISSLKARLAQIGTVVDLAGDVGISGAYAQWDANKTCYLAANVVSDAIHILVDAYRAQPFDYLTIVGPDTAVPFRRTPDRSPVAPENHYRPAYRDATAGNAALRSSQVLSDDFYGAFDAGATNTDLDVVLPDAGVGIGRVVESYEDINHLLDSYFAPGGNVLAPSTAAVTAYDFLADLGQAETLDLQSAGLTVAAKIELEGLGAQDPTAWSADDLKAILGSRHDLLALNAHFSAPALRAANGTHLTAADLAAVADLNKVLMVSNGCHAGFDTIDGDVILGSPTSEFASTLNGHGGYLVAGSGYQYGGVKTTNYNEIIQRDLVHEFRFGTGAVSVGKALTNVKRAYHDAFTNLNVMDFKALNETVFYGIPQFGVNIAAAGRLSRTSTPVAATSLGNGLSYHDFAPGYTLNPNDITANAETRSFYDIGGNTQEVAGFPIEPRLVQPAGGTDNGPTLSRGAVLFGATYTDRLPGTYVPLAEIPATESKLAFPAFVSAGVYPTMPFRLNSGENLVFTPVQFVPTTPTDRHGTGRLFSNVTARVFYYSGVNDAALAAAPSIYDVVVTKTGPTTAHVTFKVIAAVAPGIFHTFVTYTATTGTLHGQWLSTELSTPTTTTVFTDGSPVPVPVSVLNTYATDIDTSTGGATADAPEDVRLFIQAVGGNGAVGLATNRATYFRIPPAETATATAPKQPTALATIGVTPVTYGGTLTVTSKLTLADGTTALPGKAVRFGIGPQHQTVTTAADGTATASVIAGDVGTLAVTASFAEDLGDLGSAAQTTVTVGQATPALVTLPSTGGGGPPSLTPSGQYSDLVYLAKLSVNGRPIVDESVKLVLGGATRIVQTDAWGQITLNTLDFGGLAPSATPYNVTLGFPVLDTAPDPRYASVSLSLAVTVTPESATVRSTTASPQAKGSAVLTGTVTQQADGSNGDLTKATLGWTLTPDPDMGTGATATTLPQTTVPANGTVSASAGSVGAGLYVLSTTVGGYFTQSGPLGGNSSLALYDALRSISASGQGNVPTSPNTRHFMAGDRIKFSYSASYPSGATTPSAAVTISVPAEGFTLQTLTADWSVVFGNRAILEGPATVNGQAGWRFRIISVDGATADTFELKAWQPGLGSAANPFYWCPTITLSPSAIAIR